MSKRTLGRGLGDLLGSNRSAEPVPEPKSNLNPGLRILIAGAPQTSDETPTAPIVPLPETEGEAAIPPNGIHLGTFTRMLAVTGLASADVALIGWAAQYAVLHKHNMSFGAAAGCTCSILVAALCGTTAAKLLSAPGKK